MSVVGAIIRRPGLWPTAVRQWWRLVPTAWWRRRPFLPVPDREYLRFRRLTQYGDTEGPLSPGDVVNYLTWCKGPRWRQQ